MSVVLLHPLILSVLLIALLRHAPAGEESVEDAYRLARGAAAGEVKQLGTLRLRWCPAGTFLMGSPVSEAQRRAAQEPPHRVTLTTGFWLAERETTQGEWKAVMGSLPKPKQALTQDDLPVAWVTADEALQWCERYAASLDLPAGWSLTLPTEAQWEYACRAGTSTAFAYGPTSDPKRMTFDANQPYGHQERGEKPAGPTVAGTHPANPWGLYDLHGNVFEWCRDWFGDVTTRDVVDPFTTPVPHVVVVQFNSERGLPIDATAHRHAARGGGFSSPGYWCRSAHRLGVAQLSREFCGFRPALVYLPIHLPIHLPIDLPK